MPLYIHKVKKEKKIHHGKTFILGGYTAFMCGDFDIPHCFDCMDFGDFLCDYPVGHGKTCDRPMCDEHRNNIAPELDYCDAHNQEYLEFRKTNELKEIIENVIPFKHRF